MERNSKIATYWSQSADFMLTLLDSNPLGLEPATAANRLAQIGSNPLKTNHLLKSTLQLFINQFRSPLVLILIFAAIVALLVKDWLDALIVLAIVGMTAVLSFIQEHRATRAVEKLRQQIATKSTVLRGGQTIVVPSGAIVPGDIILLSTGNSIPADGILLEAKDFHVAEALLTGETFPVEKRRFKKQLPEEGATHFIINRHGFEKCLTLYPLQSWDPIFSDISKLNDFDPKVREFRRYFLHGATQLELDSAGRLLVPKNLAEHAGLEKDIVLVSAINKIEIWDKSKYKQFLETFTPQSFSDLANEVMNRRDDKLKS